LHEEVKLGSFVYFLHVLPIKCLSRSPTY
jgi:hypothetical protein